MKKTATGVKATDLQAYMDEAQGLERDLLDEIVKSKRNAWRLSGIFAVFGLLGLAAGYAGLSQDAPDPLVLRVDNATGSVDAVTVMQQSQVSYGEVVDTYWLNQYVLAREAYDWATLQRSYDTSTLLSSPDVQREYFALFEGPQARDVVLSNSAKIDVAIRSITPDPDKGIAVVRYATTLRRSNGITEPTEYWVASIGYSYVNAAMTAADRRINPLGFQVTSYRRDPEVIKAN